MKLKNKLIFLIAGLALLSPLTLCQNTVHASSKYMTRTVRLRRFYPSRVYAQAFSRRTYKINKGSRIYERIHWHMGRDGYDIHVYGKNGWYYGPWWHGYGYYFSNRVRRHANKVSHFKRTNNKRLLKKSGYSVGDDDGTITIFSNYTPFSSKAYIPKKFHLERETYWVPNSPNIAYTYQGHGRWHYINFDNE